MAQLTALLVSHDDEFKRQAATLLRACGVPVGIVDGRATDGSHPDVAVVDLRADAASGMSAIERLRATHASMAIFAVALAAEPDLILGAMRAGANEFFPWTTGGQTQAVALDGRVLPRRGAQDRGAARGGQRQHASTVRQPRVPRRQGRRRARRRCR